MKIDLAWHRYYWRVIGAAIAGGGLALVGDELINGPFHIGLGDHETWGLVAFVVGCLLIARMPKGKD